MPYCHGDLTTKRCSRMDWSFVSKAAERSIRVRQLGDFLLVHGPDEVFIMKEHFYAFMITRSEPSQ